MYLDFMSTLHKSTQRDYLARVNDVEYPKHKAASLAKQYGFDYWDGDRRINYGGYRYIPGRWTPLATSLIRHYNLTNSSAILDVGCGKGFLMYELQVLLPNASIKGLDISAYAIDNAKPEIKDNITCASCTSLPYRDSEFDLVVSLNTLHNLYNYDLHASLKEIQRVSRSNSYICVESYRDEVEKANLLYWQVTCESFYTPEEWNWVFDQAGYDGDYSFIYF